MLTESGEGIGILPSPIAHYSNHSLPEFNPLLPPDHTPLLFTQLTLTSLPSTIQTTGDADMWENDKAVVSWMESKVNKDVMQSYVANKRAAALAARMGEQLSELSSLKSVGAVNVAVSAMSAQDRAVLLKALQEAK